MPTFLTKKNFSKFVNAEHFMRLWLKFATIKIMDYYNLILICRNVSYACMKLITFNFFTPTVVVIRNILINDLYRVRKQAIHHWGIADKRTEINCSIICLLCFTKVWFIFLKKICRNRLEIESFYWQHCLL